MLSSSPMHTDGTKKNTSESAKDENKKRKNKQNE
jgi:hypothetical protein